LKDGTSITHSPKFNPEEASENSISENFDPRDLIS